MLVNIKKRVKYYFLFLIVFLFINCNKDVSGTGVNCESLQEGLLNDDVSLVKSSLGNAFDMKYTFENLDKLADTISKSCDITVEYSCFNCVQTLPPQSEMGLAFLDNNGDSAIRVLNLVADTDSTFKLLNIQQ